MERTEKAYHYLSELRIRAMYNGGRGKENEESGEFAINPDPVPYQPSNFMSSTVLKKYPAPRRHLDTFGGLDFSMGSKRGVILHTDRYQWERAFDGMNQRERLEAELEYIERLRGIKRRREVLPHRAQLDLLMGGKKIEFRERFDIQREIQKLKSLILPQNARDLFHGRGFTLPESHNSVQPRRTLPADVDTDEFELTNTFPTSKYSLDPETGRARPKWQKQGGSESTTTFPKINSRGYMLGATQPAYLQRSKTNVTRPKPVAARSLTAVPGQKFTKERPAATAPPVPTHPPYSVPREIKIPVSARESEDQETPDKRPHVEEDVEIETVHDEGESRKPVSRLSQHTRQTSSRTKAATPNPLKGSELPASFSKAEQEQLKQTFQKLDTDADGHLLFNQLQTQLPKQFSQTQERFIKQVYEITSSSTFFGVDEFMTMSYLTQTVTSLRGDALSAYDRIDFPSLHETILRYVEFFQSIDRSHRGKMKLDSLRQILQQTLAEEMKPDSKQWAKIQDVISPSEIGMITKIEFLAHIPYFETLKSK